MHRIYVAVVATVFSVFTVGLAADEQSPAQRLTEHAAVIDATTLHHKVLCGYQGWFRCPGDPAGGGWRHWSRNGRSVSPGSLTFEMWPDLSEYGDDEKFVATGFTHADGSPAHLFSSAHPKTVERHFEWMRRYGIDGAFVQRFLVELRDPSTDLVLEHCRAAAAKSGRTYAICYDMSGMSADRLFETLTEDWKRLVDERGVTRDERYLHHDGKPVMFVWGFFSDRFGPEHAHRVIDFLKADSRYAATLIGGCPWYWRQEQDADWARAFRRFDVLSPWNVGHYREENGRRLADTSTWKDDRDEARRAGMDFLPVIFPGFGWTNLQGPKSARATIPRLGGEFFWNQFVDAAELELDMAYVAMFDEVDEGTAILKVSNSPPVEGKFTTYDGLPSDWYLRLAGEGTRVIRGDRKASSELPIRP
jgi:hypothetical protein